MQWTRMGFGMTGVAAAAAVVVVAGAAVWFFPAGRLADVPEVRDDAAPAEGQNQARETAVDAPASAGSGQRVESADTPAAPQEAAVAPAPAQVVEFAPDFTLNRLGGGTLTLAEYRGEKPVILDFWASWCHNCQRDMPKLNAWYGQYHDQVEVIGVNLQERESVAQSYIDRAGIDFPVVLDPRGQASGVYGVQYTNTHVLIDKVGSVVRVIPGDISEQDITSLIAGSTI